MTIQTITALPTPVPSRLDPVNFASRADAFLGALPTFGNELNEFATEANTLALQVQDNKDSTDETYSDMQDLKNVMEGVYNNSVATSNFKGTWNSLTGALSKPASVFHNNSYWILLENILDITLSEPSDLNTDWLKSSLKALDTTYDPTTSSLSSTNVQEAIDEVYDYASGYLGNGSATNVSDSAKKTAREWLGVGPFGFKNRLINPEFSISQQYGASGINIPSGTSAVYTIDQWYASASGSNVVVQQIAGIGLHKYSLRINGSNANTAFMLGQRIESNNCFDLKNKNVTVSFNAKSTSARTLTWTAYYANVQDVFSSKTTIASGTIDITTITEKYNFTFNAGSNAGNGIAIEFSGGALLLGSSIDFDAVQLEDALIATEFEKRPIQAEYLLCKRYCEILKVGYIMGTTAVGQNVGGVVTFAVRKFSSPTFGLISQEQDSFPSGLCILHSVTTESIFVYKGSLGGNNYANWIQTYLVTARL